MSNDKSTPNPGSKEAREQGCTCPVIDNNYGHGYYVDEEGTAAFWINEACPIHGKQEGTTK